MHDRNTPWFNSTSKKGFRNYYPFFPNMTSDMVEIEGYQIPLSLLLRHGYIPPHAQLMSSKDMEERFGRTRQYWEKLFRQEKIPYIQTSAGKITTDLWVKAFFNNKELVNSYTRNARRHIRKLEIESNTPSQS